MQNTYVLTLSCHDVKGIVAAVTGFLAKHNGFIIESAQFGDASTGRFFLRIEFSILADIQHFRQAFQAEIADIFAMQWKLRDTSHKMKVLVMVSRYGHCLNDLLHRVASGNLAVEIPVVVSNHNDFRGLVEWYKIPFHYLPIEAGKKAEQEAKIKEISEQHEVDLVVLARYMQVLSPDLCDYLAGNAINIHHSFLPGFKGAKPYHQAFDRGVKLIGATAHYVTSDLDEGPIIEQEVARVDHAHKPEALEAIGRDTECVVLARAIKYHSEQRVLINGNKTVVFR